MSDAQFFAAAYLIVCKFPKQFRKGFDDWLYGNVAIQRAFENEALRVATLGRHHYSAHTIIEYLRHYTMLHSVGTELKIPEMWTSSMARLLIHMNPTLITFIRTTEGRGVVGPLSFV